MACASFILARKKLASVVYPFAEGQQSERLNHSAPFKQYGLHPFVDLVRLFKCFDGLPLRQCAYVVRMFHLVEDVYYILLRKPCRALWRHIPMRC